MLASLNHPNIAAIYGFEDTRRVRQGRERLVLELVEGPTLADADRAGRITLDEALPIARQIAEALEAAHERGIVHRDLKPANVKVRTDGMVKVLDFGLARALEGESSGAARDAVAYRSAQVVSADGIIVGTPAYMAPEQARGKPADKRTDLWAFGCVFYEMLTGRRAFAGEDTSETLAAVIKDDPDWGALTQSTPSSIRRLLRRCLAKDPKARLADASIARIEIDEALAEPMADIPVATTSRRRERFVWISALLLVAVAAVAASCGRSVRVTCRRDALRDQYAANERRLCRWPFRPTGRTSCSSRRPRGETSSGCVVWIPSQRSRCPGPTAPCSRSGRPTV